MIQRIKQSCGSSFSNIQNILFALEENAIHQRSKPRDASIESNRHRFGLPTDNHRRHSRKEEACPHLHTEDHKSKRFCDYTQQDLSTMAKRWPLDMQGFEQD
jgi:hypothetical protein